MTELVERVAALEVEVAALRALLTSRPPVALRPCSMANADLTKIDDVEWVTAYRLVCPGCGREVGMQGRHWISRHFAPREG